MVSKGNSFTNQASCTVASESGCIKLELKRAVEKRCCRYHLVKLSSVMSPEALNADTYPFCITCKLNVAV